MSNPRSEVIYNDTGSHFSGVSAILIVRGIQMRILIIDDEENLCLIAPSAGFI
jgi:hypothetical protein